MTHLSRIKTWRAPSRVPTLSALLMLVLFSSARAQSTIQFGFEEYDVGATSPYVAASYSAVGSANTRILPFEGQKFLFVSGGVSLSSPNGQLIQSFSFHLFVPTQPFYSSIRTYVADQRPQSFDFDAWQKIDGAFTTPVQTLQISEINFALEAGVPFFAIDSVEFTTVPEPQTFWLLTPGLGAILLRRSKSLKTQSG